MPKTEPKFTQIVIFRGKQEIRTYSKEVHGQDFIKLANEFINKHQDYTIETR